MRKILAGILTILAAALAAFLIFAIATPGLANPVPVSKQVGQWSFRPSITAGSTVTLTVTVTDPVTTPTPAPAFAATPTIAGTPQTDSVLTASEPTVTNGSIASRGWYRNGSAIAGATSTTYTITDADNGASLTYKVSATGTGGTTSATSTAKTAGLFTTALPAEAVAAGYTHQVFADEMLAPSSIHTEGAASGSGLWSQNYWYGNDNDVSSHNDYQYDANATGSNKSCGVNTMTSSAYTGDSTINWSNGQLVLTDGLAANGAAGAGNAKYVSTSQGSNCGKYLGAIMTTTRGHYGKGNGANQGYELLYGYVEARIFFPATPGHWDAFWMETNVVQTSRINEFDIAEVQTVEQNHNYSTIHEHSPTNGNTDLNRTPFAITTMPNGGALAGWHTYGLNWTPTEVDVYVDGVKTGSYPASTYSWIAHMDQPMFFILTHGSGNDNSGLAVGSYPDPAQIPSAMKVDYVRAYQ